MGWSFDNRPIKPGTYPCRFVHSLIVYGGFVYEKNGQLWISQIPYGSPTDPILVDEAKGLEWWKEEDEKPKIGPTEQEIKEKMKVAEFYGDKLKCWQCGAKLECVYVWGTDLESLSVKKHSCKKDE